MMFWKRNKKTRNKAIVKEARFIFIHEDNEGKVEVRTIEDGERMTVGIKDGVSVADLEKGAPVRLEITPDSCEIVSIMKEEESRIVVRGTVVKALLHDQFEVVLKNNHRIIAYFPFKFGKENRKTHKLRVSNILHDLRKDYEVFVDVEISSYDMTRGKIIRRHRTIKPAVPIANTNVNDEKLLKNDPSLLEPVHRNYCHMCGVAVQAESKFCAQCGVELN